MRLVISILVLVIFQACSSVRTVPELKHPAGIPRPARSGLLWQDAVIRSRAISNIRYDLNVNLEQAQKPSIQEFTGTVTIRFDFKKRDPDLNALTIDFERGKIDTLKVNGMVKQDPGFNGYFISVPVSDLVEAENTIEVSFHQKYSDNGSGFHRFFDPEDGKGYLYTDFEPYHAHLLFPCFDQPDLKASYTLEVTAPAEWVVVTSVREKETPADKNGVKIWKFPTSARFSTYLLSLIAGPYHVWESTAGEIPLRLLSRESLAQFVPTAEWFALTTQGLQYYGEYFGYPYPFKKYDQIIVPDFNPYAMENVAAVTFTERALPRGRMTEDDREGRANVILHEMAHMWFGNLVTMKWWDDLWLNESFATFAATQALVSTTEYKDAWEKFFVDEKQSAYREDNLVTTHPVRAAIEDTDQAFANFDAITYSKGASTLKQLQYKVGTENFRKGLKKYFKKYEYANAEFDDFIDTVGNAADEDLTGWANQWLRTAGVDQLQAEFQCDANLLTTIAVSQSTPNQVAREHHTQVALFNADGTKFTIGKMVQIAIHKQKTEVTELHGEACPEFVFVNYDDYDYSEIVLGESTIAKLKGRISSIDQVLARSMVWAAFWKAAREGKYSMLNFYQDALLALRSELAFTINQQLLGYLVGTSNSPYAQSVLNFLPRLEGTGAQFRRQLRADLEAFLWDKLQRAEPGSDFQLLWFDNLVRIASSNTSLKNLAALFKGQRQIKDLDLGQDRRWKILRALSAGQYPGVDFLVRQEQKIDGSDRGKKEGLACEVLVPTYKNKAKWYHEIVKPHPTLAFPQAKVAMENLFTHEQVDLRARFLDFFFEDLAKLNSTREDEFLSYYSRTVVPTICREESVKALEFFLKDSHGLSPSVDKTLKIARQEDERCVAIRDKILDEIMASRRN